MKPSIEELRAQVRVILEPIDVTKAALYRLFGQTHRLKLVPDSRGFGRVTQGAELPGGSLAFESLPEAYVTMTGDSDFRRIGQLAAADFQSALGDVLNCLLLRNYADDSAYRWREIVTSVTSLDNFRPQRRSRLGFVEDLPDLGAEDTAYNELVTHGDEGFDYSANQKGGLLTFTRRTIMNDGVGAVRSLVEQAGNAAMRAMAKRVWNKVINNDNYLVDATAWFDSTHGNLGSAALSVSALNTARAAIFAQTHPGSSERLGQSGPYLLAIPIELEATAFGINNSQFEPGTTDGSANPWFHRFGDHGERVFTSPLFEDANDWALFDVGGKAGILEVGFLLGKQAPQIFIAHDERADQMLSQDRIRYKVRHEYEVAIEDYRASYKSVVS